MKISMSWAQHYANVDLLANGKDALLEKIGAQLGAIEEVVEWGPRYDGIVVAKIISCDKHPNAYKLQVCTIDDGGVVKDVKRDAEGRVQVVCGAPNARADLLVAWIPPGVTVPSTLGKEPFELEAKDIRGVISNGMLASPKELGISDSHDGILEIDAAEVGELATPGTSFKQLYGMDDLVIDIENKMFTHRPDLFGILGDARELAGIQGLAFESPDWYKQAQKIELAPTNLQLTSTNEVTSVVPRFMVQVVEGIAVKPSPVWLQAGLTRLGIRPINNVVDLSNYYMQLTGQPTHAFDYDKVKALSGDIPTLGPRMAREGEELTLLGGKKIKLTTEDIVIATDKQSVALAGIMGGVDTEVDEQTKTIIIECATFDMYTTRRSTMRHGLFTDAATRFTKGQSPLQNDRVLAKLNADLQAQGAKPTALVINHKADTVRPPANLTLTAAFINDRLGIALTANDMATLLKNVEFAVSINGDELSVTAPFWRTDIEIAEDIVEEVGRLHGYDHLPLVLPTRDLTPARADRLIELRDEVRQLLSRAGANELLTYSFVHGQLLNTVGQQTDHAFQLANALSPDLQYYRLSLTPSLLEKVHPNLKAGFDHFALFEVGKVHNKQQMDTDEPAVPQEVNALALVVAADAKQALAQSSGAPYYVARRYLDELLEYYGVDTEVRYQALAKANLYDNPWLTQLVAPFQPERSAVLVDAKGMVWGVVGEFTASARRSLKLPPYCAGFELDPLLLLQSAGQRYQPLSRFPRVEQDISLRVPAELTYQQLHEFVQAQIEQHKPDNTVASLTPLDIYQRQEDQAHKQIAFRLSITSYERTLTDEEVNSLLDQVAAAAKEQFGAERL